jgi:hypothetical protein
MTAEKAKEPASIQVAVRRWASKALRLPRPARAASTLSVSINRGV